MATETVILASKDLDLLHRIERLIREHSPFTPLALGTLTKIDDKHDGSFQITFAPTESYLAGSPFPPNSSSTGYSFQEWSGHLPGTATQ